MTKSASILRRFLVKVKQAMPDSKNRGVVYEVPCKDCLGVLEEQEGPWRSD